MLQNKYSMVTFTQDQGQKVTVKGPQKVSLPFSSQIVKATVIKFGTMLPCDKVLLNKHGVVTFTQGQGKKVKG